MNAPIYPDGKRKIEAVIKIYQSPPKSTKVHTIKLHTI